MTTKSLILFAALVLVAAGATREAQSPAKDVGISEAKSVAVVESRPETPLYLHLFSSSADPKNPPQRIVTTRVSPPQDICIFTGPVNGKGDEVLAGRIERRGDVFFGDLKGRLYTTANFYKGEIRLEKPFGPQMMGFSSIVFPATFVLSTNSDCSPFLKVHGE